MQRKRDREGGDHSAEPRPRAHCDTLVPASLSGWAAVRWCGVGFLLSGEDERGSIEQLRYTKGCCRPKKHLRLSRRWCCGSKSCGTAGGGWHTAVLALVSQVLAGSDNGLLRLFDISNALPKDADTPYGHDVLTFDRFEQLTSVHINSTDEHFLVSGYTKNVALYDIGTGRLLQLLNNLHQEPINVAKFAYHSPFMFATSSFDHDVKMWDLRQRIVRPCYSATSSRGNVMVCFSPDDQYLLVSAIDNEKEHMKRWKEYRSFQLLTIEPECTFNF